MILTVDGICMKFKEKVILDNVNLSVEKGEVVSIVGPNGCGKSTLLKILSRNLSPQKGNVCLHGKSIKHMKPKDLAKKLAFLPQSRSVSSDFSVETLVSYGRYPHLGFSNRLKAMDLEIVDWAMDKTRVLELRNRTVNTLSGGEAQRTWIAMALAQRPDILLLDEPTTFLDISFQLEVMELIKELNQTLGLTIIMVLHDINQAVRYSHKIYALKNSTISHHGHAHQILSHQFLSGVFNIDADIFTDDKNNCPYIIPQRVKKL
ncbi:ABC transporter ATP-binding protein [Alkaliphilus peptidifermentans]|uniref:Iron complex transport system ATP-binding protein n=1 Tax=Alkaliphilus peptidifermentans DSM 18978 TaxID=1120976 RepID=A0A1G5AS01_9FIRM|nr:ABC transporter ATP-binding protein [Alkaliphilus peptidifermentans]SCX80658.1 iron complex transport system ATP-binding protein [Alkaliphilus peptidifermentans DSM 18978]